MGITVKDSFKPKIIEELRTQPLTIKQLANRLGANYYTIRNAIRELQEDGDVAPTGQDARNVEYSLGIDQFTTYSMPSITTYGQKYKVFRLMEARDNPNNKAAIAVQRMPVYITQIMMIAKAYSQNRRPQFSLLAIKESMEKDLEALRNTVKIYESVLNSPKNWDAGGLARFPLDPEWNDKELEKSVAHYYPEEEE